MPSAFFGTSRNVSIDRNVGVDTGANVFLESYGTVRQVAEELGVALKRTPLAIHGGVYHNGKFHAFHGGDRLKDRLNPVVSIN